MYTRIVTYKNFVFPGKASINASLVFFGVCQLSFEVEDSNNDESNDTQCSQNSTNYCPDLNLTTTHQQLKLTVP